MKFQHIFDDRRGVPVLPESRKKVDWADRFFVAGFWVGYVALVMGVTLYMMYLRGDL